MKSSKKRSRARWGFAIAAAVVVGAGITAYVEHSRHDFSIKRGVGPDSGTLDLRVSSGLFSCTADMTRIGADNGGYARDYAEVFNTFNGVITADIEEWDFKNGIFRQVSVAGDSVSIKTVTVEGDHVKVDVDNNPPDSVRGLWQTDALNFHAACYGNADSAAQDFYGPYRHYEDVPRNLETPFQFSPPYELKMPRRDEFPGPGQ